MIYNHNKNFIDISLIDNRQTDKIFYHCKNKENRPILGMCGYEKVIYWATIFPMENRKKESVYIGKSAKNGNKSSAMIDALFPIL